MIPVRKQRRKISKRIACRNYVALSIIKTADPASAKGKPGPLCELYYSAIALSFFAIADFFRAALFLWIRPFEAALSTDFTAAV